VCRQGHSIFTGRDTQVGFPIFRYVSTRNIAVWG
jgi:hypothetical protein